MAARLKGGGTIQTMARNGKAFKLDDEEWYSVFKPQQLAGAGVGDVVEFEYEEAHKGSQTFRNVKDNVRIVGGSSERAGSSSRSSDTPRSTSSSSGGGSADRRDRQIVRQNALTQANTLFRTVTGDGGLEVAAEQEVETIIEMAKRFEAYVFGE